MKILVVGGGGREHAIVWRLSQDQENHEIYSAPGNAGMAELSKIVNLKADDIEGITAWALAEKPDLVVVGPEAPLVKGLSDELQKNGFDVFGPVADGARIEGSKSFAKEIMKAAGVPTGKAEVFDDPEKAKAQLPEYGLPVVIKADGLAAGKGVIVAETLEEATNAIDDMLSGNKFGSAGATVLIEEFLHGEECSILAVVDGERAFLLPSSQDHKRVFDGDKGPNTGGMGAYSPAPIVTDDMLPEIKQKVILPVVRELSARGIVYRGILYAGLMINENPDGLSPNSKVKNHLAASGDKINVVEFNARFGDPETEAVLPRLKGSFAKLLLNAARGCLNGDEIEVSTDSAATVIIASAGYPGDYQKGKKVRGLEQKVDNTVVFHCGTKEVDGDILTSGGRVFSVTGCGSTLREAVDRAYERVGQVSFEGAFSRTDIARRAFERG
ncbi:MAG: phosphoribosylamine--glycine ligase [Kiritimatiellae bacterium]|nr:phosphoribosylamine--glycine ligase [Kiritimatiellia bacterium]